MNPKPLLVLKNFTVPVAISLSFDVLPHTRVIAGFVDPNSHHRAHRRWRQQDRANLEQGGNSVPKAKRPERFGDAALSTSARLVSRLASTMRDPAPVSAMPRGEPAKRMSLVDASTSFIRRVGAGREMFRIRAAAEIEPARALAQKYPSRRRV